MGSIVAASPSFESWNNRQVPVHVWILHFFICKVIRVIPTLADDGRKVTVGARCLAPKRRALSSLSHSFMDGEHE